MKLTTKDIIKLLPFDEKLKTELLESFDNLDADQKFNIEGIVWGAYDAIYNLKLEENIRLALLRAENNQEKLDENFYKKAEALTDQEMQSGALEDVTNTNLTLTRNEINEILKNSKPENNPPPSTTVN